MRFGIFIYDGVEPIDLATFGVLSMARRIAPQISICTIAPRAGTVALANGLKVEADFGIADAPPCDLLIVTGGATWPAQAESRHRNSGRAAGFVRPTLESAHSRVAPRSPGSSGLPRSCARPPSPKQIPPARRGAPTSRLVPWREDEFPRAAAPDTPPRGSG